MSRLGIATVIINKITYFCLLYVSTLKRDSGCIDDVYISLKTRFTDDN